MINTDSGTLWVNRLKSSGYFIMPLALILKKFYFLPRVHVCVLYVAQNERRLLLYIELIGSYYPVCIYCAVRIECLQFINSVFEVCWTKSRACMVRWVPTQRTKAWSTKYNT